MIKKFKMAYHAFMSTWYAYTWRDELDKIIKFSTSNAKTLKKHEEKAKKAKEKHNYHYKLQQ